MCEGLQTMSHNLKALADLSERQENIQSQCESLEKEMEEFKVNLEQEVARVLARTSYVIRGPKKPATLDSPAQEMEEALLPPPLLPQTSPIPPSIPVSASSESSNTPLASPSRPPSDLTDTLPPTLPPPLLPSVDLAPSSPPTLATYVGFSAQASSIPSISCSTAATDRLLSSPASFTPSDTSSSVNSPSDSPVRCPPVEE